MKCINHFITYLPICCLMCPFDNFHQQFYCSNNSSASYHLHFLLASSARTVNNADPEYLCVFMRFINLLKECPQILAIKRTCKGSLFLIPFQNPSQLDGLSKIQAGVFFLKDWKNVDAFQKIFKIGWIMCLSEQWTSKEHVQSLATDNGVWQESKDFLVVEVPVSLFSLLSSPGVVTMNKLTWTICFTWETLCDATWTWTSNLRISRQQHWQLSYHSLMVVFVKDSYKSSCCTENQ